MLARADSEDDPRSVSGPDDHVLRPRGAVHEVPLPQRPLLALDDEKRIAGEDEEILLIGLPVVHRHRLDGPEQTEADAELREVALMLEIRGSSPFAGTSAHPARSGRTIPFPWRRDNLRRFERSLGNHRRKL